MRAAIRNPPRTAPHCRRAPTSCFLMSHLHVKKAPVGLLRRACLCHAGDDREDGAAGEDEFADSQELAGTTGSIAQEPEESESSEEARRAAFIAEYFQSSYDPMYHGKWIDVQGASMKMPDYDFSQYDWMSRVPTDIGWPTFWKHFEELTATDDEYDDEEVNYTPSGRLCMHSSQKRTRAFEAQTMLAGSPDFVAAGMEGTVKDEVPPATIIDRDRRDAEDPWELRARREKQEFRKERDYHWQVTQAMDHWQMLNHPPEDQTDVRIMEKLRGERYDWTDDEIWNIITNDGKSVDPFVMLHAPTFQTLNPLCMPDWASQGIEYVDDMEDWISQEGRWMSQAEYASVEAADGSGEDDDEDFMAVRLHICAQLLHDSYGMGHITPTTA